MLDKVSETLLVVFLKNRSGLTTSRSSARFSGFLLARM
jgi:hypothetical protein